MAINLRSFWARLQVHVQIFPGPNFLVKICSHSISCQKHPGSILALSSQKCRWCWHLKHLPAGLLVIKRFPSHSGHSTGDCGRDNEKWGLQKIDWRQRIDVVWDGIIMSAPTKWCLFSNLSLSWMKKDIIAIVIYCGWTALTQCFERETLVVLKTHKSHKFQGTF